MNQDQPITYTNQTRTKGKKCPICKYIVRTRKDGTIGSHHLWSGKEYLGRCEGTGTLPDEEE